MSKIDKWNGMIPLPVVALGIYLVILAVGIVLSIFVFKTNIVSVGVFIVLETLLAALLGRVPSWLHACIFVAQISLGMMYDQLPMMITMAVLYLAAVVLLSVWRIDFGRI
ncbi:MAG: hypothetical protein K6F00_01840 [Lachnospiraceae bacterium]|nr:hypothetical protein [Lachnospiraceae bacterium]